MLWALTHMDNQNSDGPDLIKVRFIYTALNYISFQIGLSRKNKEKQNFEMVIKAAMRLLVGRKIYIFK